MNDRLVWIDCEMTGLDLAADALIEVAVLVTDYELNVLGDGIDLVIAPPPGALEQMGDFVRDMHTESGLLDELAHGIPLADAEQQVLEFISGYVKEPRKAALLGVTAGRGFAEATLRIARRSSISGRLVRRKARVVGTKRVVRRAGTRVVRVSLERKVRRQLRRRGVARVTLTLRIAVVARGEATQVFRYRVRVRV